MPIMLLGPTADHMAAVHVEEVHRSFLAFFIFVVPHEPIHAVETRKQNVNGHSCLFESEVQQEVKVLLSPQSTR